jgi:hypothetical protein
MENYTIDFINMIKCKTISKKNKIFLFILLKYSWTVYGIYKYNEKNMSYEG